MTYQTALWSAIIGEADKFGNGLSITKAKRDRYLKLCNYWRKMQ